MLRLNRRTYATLALLAFASFARIAWVDAKGEERSDRHEHRPSEVRRPAAGLKAEARHSHREAAPTHVHPIAGRRPQMAGPNVAGHYLADGRVMRETHLGGGRVSAVSRGFAGATVRVVRYGNTLSGTVEHVIRPGLISRTFVGGGHVLYSHTYQGHVWHQFGRSFAYETLVPSVHYPAVYYSWALAAWPQPVSYNWGWQVQPWHPMFGALFTPYPVYTTPDLWMTDYILAGTMQTAYQAQTSAPASESLPQGALAAPVVDSSAASPAVQPSDAAAGTQPTEAPPPAPHSSDTPLAPPVTPPAITPAIKAQLNAQIKVQLHEQQAAAAAPAALTTQTTPPALRANHVFFQVAQPLDVPSGTANRYCSLSADDYIKRVGGMSHDDWTIPVVVELSGPSDCPEGLRTRIGLNDLNAMENEQEAQVIEAMQAASKSLGPNGPPSGPGVHPTLIADGSASPDPMALDAIRQVQ
jgi:hypothetical protein